MIHTRVASVTSGAKSPTYKLADANGLFDGLVPEILFSAGAGMVIVISITIYFDPLFVNTERFTIVLNVSYCLFVY